MKATKVLQEVMVGEIVNTLSDSDLGKGILGFVITYPDGSIRNYTAEYNRGDYDEVLQAVQTEHNKLIRGQDSGILNSFKLGGYTSLHKEEASKTEFQTKKK